MKKAYFLVLVLASSLTAMAQRTLSLDSCRALALANNHQMKAAQVKQKVAENMRKSARAKYLPHVSAVGGYLYTSKEIQLLSDEQQQMFGNIGSIVGAQAGLAAPYQMLLNGLGGTIVDDLTTDTRQKMVGSVMLTQPIFMGGAIIAANKMADISENMAGNAQENTRQQTLYDVDNAYWTVVSLKHKKALAEKYRDVVKQFSGDVKKMIAEGVATRAEGLSVDVKLNEADMTVLKVENGLSLARMLLCQLCGMPLETALVLADEDAETIATPLAMTSVEAKEAVDNRPDIRLLQDAVSLSAQSVNVVKAANLPQVALIGGYTTMNPNMYNGFHRSFDGAWNVGVLLRIPVWNWGETMHKVRAAKGLCAIASLELDEMKEKAELQIEQNRYRMNEAEKQLSVAMVNIRQADENLRCANLGFHEGVISSTTVMEAQTAWLKAQTQKIDAEIDLRMSQLALKKSIGQLE